MCTHPWCPPLHFFPKNFALKSGRFLLIQPVMMSPAGLPLASCSTTTTTAHKATQRPSIWVTILHAGADVVAGIPSHAKVTCTAARTLRCPRSSGSMIPAGVHGTSSSRSRSWKVKKKIVILTSIPGSRLSSATSFTSLAGCSTPALCYASVCTVRV